MLSDASADLVYRIGLWCLLRGNQDRAQAHLRQLREAGHKTLAYRLCTKMILSGITPCTEGKTQRIESLETTE